MSDKDLDDDDDEVWDAGLFSVDNVDWKVLPTRKRNEVTIKFYDDAGTTFTLIKIYLAVMKLAAQLEQELNVMDVSEIDQ